MVASTARTMRSLAVAATLMLAGTASIAEAGNYIAEAGGTAGTSASAAIIAPEAPPQLLRAAAGTSTAALDGEGRALSVSLPARMSLRSEASTDEIAARAALAPAGPGTGRLLLTPDRPLRQLAAAGGAYVGELRMSLDYN
jgi:hypothetical protein